MLSERQLNDFATDGFIVVPGVVPEELLVAADTEVDATLAADPPPLGTVGPHVYFVAPELLPAADAALRGSGALALAEQLVAPHQLHHGLDHIQIAVNLPPYRHRPGGPHIDGHRLDQAKPHSFTMLAAVFLVDESQPDRGNLWAWPGSHLQHERLFREHGPEVLLPVSGHPTMLDPLVEYPSPRPVLGRRGDLLLAHYLLGHNIGGNTSRDMRRILYYRLSCPGHADRWPQTFLDAFTEYAPVAAAANSRP